MFFNGRGVCRAMLLPEFEAVLDGVVGLSDLADQQVRLAYVQISPRREARAAVFFLLDFDEDGAADSGWNIPLRPLSERGGPGMDLGGGPIRLVCRSQCPIPWHQMHLWDPEPQDLLSLRDAIMRNRLGLLGEGEVSLSRLAGFSGGQGAPATAKEWSAQRRQKTARSIKRQRLHIRNLKQRHEESLEKLKQSARTQLGALQTEVQQLRDQLSRQQELNAGLEGAFERLELVEVELEACRARERLDAEEILRLQDEHARLAAQGIEQALGQLASQGLTFVVYHPGAGHLTIPLQDIDRYQANPMAYVAAQCSVSEEHYRQWLEHFQQPSCAAVLPSGRRCALPIDRVDSPRRFMVGESCHCSRHRPVSLLHRAG